MHSSFLGARARLSVTRDGSSRIANNPADARPASLASCRRATVITCAAARTAAAAVPAVAEPTRKVLTGYQLFTKENLKGVKSDSQTSHRERIRQVGQLWTSMSATDKEVWKQRAVAGEGVVEKAPQRLTGYRCFLTAQLSGQRHKDEVGGAQVMKQANADWKLLTDAEKAEWDAVAAQQNEERGL